ncbi:hypothetical protein V1517DRAFT_135093, partial [Lipomyces orientalis]
MQKGLDCHLRRLALAESFIMEVLLLGWGWEPLWKVYVAPWESKTPTNPAELASQTDLIKGKITRHQDS